MDNRNKEVRDELTHIKMNDLCNTNCLDGSLVNDLIKRGWVIGVNVQHFGSIGPEYIQLHITLRGKQHLVSLNKKTSWIVTVVLWFSTNIVTKIVVALTVLIVGFYITNWLQQTQQENRQEIPKKAADK